MQVNSLGKTLLFETNIYCFAKKELKIFAFAPVNSKGGITGTFVPLKIVFLLTNKFYCLLMDHLALCGYLDHILS